MTEKVGENMEKYSKKNMSKDIKIEKNGSEWSTDFSSSIL